MVACIYSFDFRSPIAAFMVVAVDLPNSDLDCGDVGNPEAAVY